MAFKLYILSHSSSPIPLPAIFFLLTFPFAKYWVKEIFLEKTLLKFSTRLLNFLLGHRIIIIILFSKLVDKINN